MDIPVMPHRDQRKMFRVPVSWSSRAVLHASTRGEVETPGKMLLDLSASSQQDIIAFLRRNLDATVTGGILQLVYLPPLDDREESLDGASQCFMFGRHGEALVLDQLKAMLQEKGLVEARAWLEF